MARDSLGESVELVISSVLATNGALGLIASSLHQFDTSEPCFVSPLPNAKRTPWQFHAINWRNVHSWFQPKHADRAIHQVDIKRITLFMKRTHAILAFTFSRLRESTFSQRKRMRAFEKNAASTIRSLLQRRERKRVIDT